MQTRKYIVFEKLPKFLFKINLMFNYYTIQQILIFRNKLDCHCNCNVITTHHTFYYHCNYNVELDFSANISKLLNILVKTT